MPRDGGSADLTSRILVTGGSGFVGSHLVRALVRAGADVHVLARPESTLWRIADVAPQITVWRGDLLDSAAVDRAVAAAAPEVVFHLGGGTFGRRWTADLRDIDPAIDVNLKGTVSLVRALHRADLPLRAFVRIGSLAEYGAIPTPFEETARELPTSPYAASQVATTTFLQAMQTAVRFPIVTLRMASLYGPARSTDFFLTSLILHCVEGRDFDLTSGEQLWDFLYVGDAVDACCLAARADLPKGELINVCSAVGVRLRDIAELVVRLSGSAIRLRIGALPHRAGEVPNLVGSNAKAARILGWSPTTDLEDGMRRTIDWYHEHLSELRRMQ